MNRRLIRTWSAVFFLIIGQVTAIAMIQDVIAQALHLLVDDKSLGMVMTAYLLAGMFASLVLIAVKINEQRLLFWSLPCMTVTLIGYPFAMGNTVALTIVRILHAITYAMVNNSIFLVTRRSVPEKHQARVSALAVACTYMGSGLSMAAGLHLAMTNFLWQAVIVMGMSSTLVVYASLLIQRGSLQSNFKEKAQQLWTNITRQMKRADKEVWHLAIPGIGVSVGYMAFYMWFVNTWTSHSDLVLLVATLANFLVAVTIMPWLAAHPRGYVPLMTTSNGLMVFALILIWLGDTLQVMLVAGTLMGISLSGNNLAITEAIARRVTHERQNSAFPVSKFVSQIGGVIGSLYSSVMWVLVGRTMWLTVVPVLVLFLLSLYYLHKKPRREFVFSEISREWTERLGAASALAAGKTAGEQTFPKREASLLKMPLDWFAARPKGEKLRIIHLFTGTYFYLEKLRQKMPSRFWGEVQQLLSAIDVQLLKLLNQWQRVDKTGFEVFSNMSVYSSVGPRVLCAELITDQKRKAESPEGEIYFSPDWRVGFFWEGDEAYNATYQIPNLFAAIKALGVVDIRELEAAYEKETKTAKRPMVA